MFFPWTGPLREFFNLASRALFGSNSAYFQQTPNNDSAFVRPRKPSEITPVVERRYECFGRLLALSLLFKRPMGFNLSLVLIKVLLQQPLSWEDLKGFDELLSLSQ